MNSRHSSDPSVTDKYLALVSHMQQGFCIIEALFDAAGQPLDYRFVEVNSTFETLTGLVNPVGKTLRQVQPVYELPWFDACARVIATGQPVHFENEVTRSAGNVWYDGFAFSFGPDQNGQVAVLLNDITRSKQTEQALRQREERIAFSLKLSDALRSLSDTEAIQATVTRITRDYFGADRCYYCEIHEGKALIRRDASRPDLPSVVGEYPLRSFTLLQAVVDAGQPFVVSNAHTSDILDEPIRQLCIQLQIISFLNVPVIKNGQPTGVLCLTQCASRDWGEQEVQLVQETAERTWAAVERARVEEALREEYRRKDEFLAMMGHELRNPLAVIANTLLILELTRGEDESLPYAKGIQILTRHSQHLNQMVDDLLDMSRIRQGVVRIQRQPLDLAEVVRHTVEAVRPLYQEENRHLDMVLPADPVYVYGDETRLSQVVMNLLTNGAKFTDEEGHVRVTLEQEGIQAVLRVKDDGIGLTPAERTSIFEVFVQGATTLDRPHGGLGLGLAVVKHLVEQHGGQIEAFSPGLDQGSEFVIRLPLLTEELPQLDDSDDQKGRHPALGRILLVDNNTDFAEITARILRHRGYEVYTRYTGAQGLAAAESLQPDVLLLDIGMPYLDGYEVCRQIRQQPWGQSMAILALTGYGQEADRQQAIAAGFDDYLVKPINTKTLVQAIAQAIQDTGRRFMKNR